MSGDGFEVPGELCGAVAAVLRWSLPKLAIDFGHPDAVPHGRALLELQAALAEHARRPVAASGNESEAACEGGSTDAGMVPAAEAATRLDRPLRTLSWQCANGKVRGARPIGRTWHVPALWLANEIDDMNDEHEEAA